MVPWSVRMFYAPYWHRPPPWPAYRPNPYAPYVAHPNPISAGTMIILALAGIAVVGGAIYFGIRSAQSAPAVAPAPAGKLPALPPAEPARPIPPIPPSSSADAQTLQFWDTPVAYVELLLDPEASPRPYYVSFASKVDMPYRDGEVAFGTEAEARDFALGKAYPLGVALDEDDLLVHHDFQSSHGGGGVWQAQDGSFYITWNVADSSGQESPFATADEARAALHERLTAAGLGLTDVAKVGVVKPGAKSGDAAPKHAQFGHA